MAAAFQAVGYLPLCSYYMYLSKYEEEGIVYWTTRQLNLYLAEHAIMGRMFVS